MAKAYKKQIINELVAETGLAKKDVENVVNALFAKIKGKILNGDTVVVHGFGTFYPRKIKEREFNSSIAGKVVKIKSGTKIALRSKTY